MLNEQLLNLADGEQIHVCATEVNTFWNQLPPGTSSLQSSGVVFAVLNFQIHLHLDSITVHNSIVSEFQFLDLGLQSIRWQGSDYFWTYNVTYRLYVDMHPRNKQEMGFGGPKQIRNLYSDSRRF